MATPTPPIRLSHLTPAEAVADALYRAVQGLDTNNRTLFDSAWIESEDEDGPNAPSFSTGNNYSVGKANIDRTLFHAVGPMDTHHMISNVRVHFLGDDKAEMSAYAHAQHHRAGEGMLADKKGLLGGAMYFIDLEKDGREDGLWRIKKWVNKILWADGDMSVMGR